MYRVYAARRLSWLIYLRAFFFPTKNISLRIRISQMWDKDILYNDCIAEGMLDLGRHFRHAYKKKTDVLKLFETVQTERAKEAIVKTQQELKSEQVCNILWQEFRFVLPLVLYDAWASFFGL